MSDAARKKKRLERVLKVQAQKRQIEEWALAQLKQKHDEIDRSDREILDSLDPEHRLHGLFVEAKVKSLRRNDVERRRNEEEQKLGEARLAEVRLQEKGIERRMKAASREAASDVEAAALESHVESFLARLANSLG
ncbi:hypothetical protein DYI37_15505 [Fulvimarina endophytica]|uniref:Flagellar FliJ protein n=1 Tax=Fulvimarina endophytica TaxID=2293836 RepID=A0A371X078_9HYPH|nr:hypothetical protein [Fulvimarina endophytica]RFC62638.1 hypothetical protein DYI37_15505 [Fulvimarina endophytica]